jgi:hypothetical protein
MKMSMPVAFVIGFVICGLLGYWLGAYVACYWLYLSAVLGRAGCWRRPRTGRPATM